MSKSKQAAKLILANGQIFAGESFGFQGPIDGEVVFNTGMTGFELSLTDPSYAGQILVFTFPLVGNFGIPDRARDEYGILKYFESEKIQVRGVVMTKASEEFSHHNAIKSLDTWLKENRIPALTGVDTRALTQTLREYGTCLGQIVQQDQDIKTKIPDPNATNLVAAVCVKKPQVFSPKKFQKTILAIDTGIKNNILRCFLRRNIRVILVPWDYQLTDRVITINKERLKIDGLFLANGPGDPKQISAPIAKTVQYAYQNNLPIFGICMGNHIVALSMGGDTYKLKYGHRGVNQPCQDLLTRKCYVTSQNHGFAVNEKKLPKNFIVWFKNLNDGTVEGLRHRTKPIFSVQFHPEACPGPQDTEYLFDEFIKVL